jgi:carboxylate-amine ligase
VPRELRDFEDFCAMSELLSRAADVPDYTWFWWKLRPHPRLGTVEIRALDSQSSLPDLVGLVALVHCLAREAATGPPVPAPPSEILDEGAFRAARYGMQAELPGPDGRHRPAVEILDSILSRIGAHALELGCEAELATLGQLVSAGGGAARQREAYRAGGMETLLRALIEDGRLTRVGSR